MSTSFQGFLTKYCKELPSSNTTSLKQLFNLAESFQELMNHFFCWRFAVGEKPTC